MNKIRMITIALLLIIGINGLLANQVPRETVIAEYDGGKILFGYIEDRINKIPPQYQTKYKTEDGMISLLDMMCTEEVFYLESLAMEIEKTDKFKQRSEMQIRSLLSSEYRKDLLAENVILTEEEKQSFFVEHSEDMYAGRVFDEVVKDIEGRLKSQKDQEFTAQYIEQLKEKYNVVINDEILAQIDLNTIESNESTFTEKLYSSSEPKIERNVNYLVSILPDLPPQQKEILKQPDKLREYVVDMSTTWALAYEAEEKGYLEREILVETATQIKKNVLLRSVYNHLVVEAVVITDETLMNYYNENIETYSSKATRKIQIFTFTDEDLAKQILKKVEKALKKDDLEKLNTLITENSTYTNNNGIINNIYNNGIVPGFGKDAVLAQMIWADPALKLKSEFSEIFLNGKNEYTFFQLLEDNPSEAQPFDQVKDKIRSKLDKDLTRSKFDEVTAQLKTKYNLVTYNDKMFAVLTSEEYFNLAEEAQKKRRYQDAVYYYSKVIKNHKNQKDDYKALFMTAFLYAEEIDDKDQAIQLFDQLINEFPEGDLHESARFMIMELEGKSNIIESFESEAEIEE